MPNLIVLAGLPGAGKSTWAKTFFDLKYSIVSSDEIRKGLAGSLREAHEKAISPWDVFYKQIADRLTHSVDVIADATFLTRKHRDRAREVADKTGAALHLVMFDNWTEAFERNADREEATRVPANVMNDMLNLFWETLYLNDDEEYVTTTHIGAFA